MQADTDQAEWIRLPPEALVVAHQHHCNMLNISHMPGKAKNLAGWRFFYISWSFRWWRRLGGWWIQHFARQSIALGVVEPPHTAFKLCLVSSSVIVCRYAPSIQTYVGGRLDLHARRHVLACPSNTRVCAGPDLPRERHVQLVRLFQWATIISQEFHSIL
jgi:hypothetical protein